MAITSKDVDAVITDVQEFGRAHFGLKNGTDFPEMVSSLGESERFQELCERASLMAVLTATLLQSRGAVTETNAESEIRRFLSDSPVRVIVADVLYIGYCLGKRVAETELLRKMSETKTSG